MFPSKKYRSNWVNDWYDAYVDKLPKSIMKKPFAEMLGFENFVKLKSHLLRLSDEDINKFQKSILQHNDENLNNALVQALFSKISQPTVIDCFKYLKAYGELSSKDINEYAEKGCGDMAVNVVPSFTEIVKKSRQLSVKFSDNEKRFILKKYTDHINPDVYDSYIRSESSLYSLSDSQFYTLYQNLSMQLKDKLNLTKGVVAWILKLAVKKGFTNYSNIANAINMNNEWGDSTRRELANKKTVAEKTIAVSIWLGDKKAEDDKKCLEFYRQYCKPTSTQMNRSKRHHPLTYFREEEYQDELPSIDHILTSKSDLAPPVLATYLLYNFASLDFKTERCYSILFVIQKMEILKPLVNMIEPLLKIDREKSFSDSDLKNDFVANFILLNKIKLIETDPDGYFNFIHSLYSTGKYELIIGEASRMIEITKLSIGNTKLDEYLIRSVQNISECSLSQIPLVLIEAAYLVLRRAGYEAKRLLPHVSNNKAESFDNLCKKEVSLYFKNSRESNRITQNIVYFDDKNNRRYQGYHHDSYYDLFGRMIEENNLNLTVDKIDYSFTGMDSIAQATTGNLRNGSILEEKLTGKFKKIYNHFYDHSAIDISNVGSLAYLSSRNISSSRWLRKKYETKYISKNGELIFIELPSGRLLNYALTKHKPSSITVLSTTHIYTNNENWRKPEKKDMFLKVETYVLSIKNIESEMIENLNIFIEHSKGLNLSKYFGHNPFTDIIKKHVPKFYYMDQCINEEGKEY